MPVLLVARVFELLFIAVTPFLRIRRLKAGLKAFLPSAHPTNPYAARVR
jgi:hypothetical protein